MAPQDYVSRANARKKAKNPYKAKTGRKNSKTTKNQETKNIKVKLVGILTISLISAATIGLWQLKTNPVTKDPVAITKQNQQNTTKAVKSSETNENNTELPSPPDETWTYVDELQKEKAVVGEYEVKEHGPYKMVCGSFKQRSRAETLKAQMAFAGIESVIQTAKNGSTTWHKVALGPYSKKRMAEKDKSKLKKNKITGCQIWLWR